jgi:hypothetical protein
MPRQPLKARAIFCDCFDCNSSEPILQDVKKSTRVSEGRETPIKCLTIIGSGFIRRNEAGLYNLDSDTVTYPHINRVARDGCLGMLSLPFTKQMDSVKGCSLSKTFLELAEILDEFQVRQATL